MRRRSSPGTDMSSTFSASFLHDSTADAAVARRTYRPAVVAFLLQPGARGRGLRGSIKEGHQSMPIGRTSLLVSAFRSRSGGRTAFLRIALASVIACALATVLLAQEHKLQGPTRSRSPSRCVK